MLGFRNFNFAGGQSTRIAVSTPTYAFGTPTPSSINEDGTTQVSFPITTTNVTDETRLYPRFILNGVAQAPTPTIDLDGDQNVNIISNSGTANAFALADSTTEGPQSLYCELYTDSGFTNLVATSSSITVNDTSTSPPSFTYVGLGSSLASTVTIPAIAAVGDIAVLFDTSTTTTLTVPSGFTQINSVSTTGIRTTYSYRTLTAGQPGSSITGMAGTTRKLLLVFRPSVTPLSITAVSNAGQATSQAPTNQSLPLLAALEPNLAFAVYGWTTSTPTRTWTQTGSTATITTNNSTSGISVYYEINNAGSNPQNATASMTDGGTNTMMTGYIRFT